MAVPESQRQFCPRITPGQRCKKYTNQAKSILFIWTTKLNNKKLTQHVQLFLYWICFSVPGRKEKTKLVILKFSIKIHIVAWQGTHYIFFFILVLYINRTTFYLAYWTFFSKIELKIQLQVSSVINTKVINIKDLLWIMNVEKNIETLVKSLFKILMLFGWK